MKRKIIQIDEEKCNGCGSCITGCPEGALQIIDGKARLVSDLCCDGLGACVGTCPEGAMEVVEREAEEYDESEVMANIVRQGNNTIKAHLKHLREHGEMQYLKEAVEYLQQKEVATAFDPRDYLNLSGGCPSAMARHIERKQEHRPETDHAAPVSQLNTWPIQLALVNPLMPFLDNADLLISADCVPFAFADFHRQFLKDRILILFCPKLDTDRIESYITKLAHIFKVNEVKSITIPRMEVPCCSGTVRIVEAALERSGKDIPMEEYIISVGGDILT